jgi:hypothetical protein
MTPMMFRRKKFIGLNQVTEDTIQSVSHVNPRSWRGFVAFKLALTFRGTSTRTNFRKSRYVELPACQVKNADPRQCT